MMKTTTNQSSTFLTRIEQPDVTKEEIFEALFEARGCGADVNTNHVFFQEVIIKFNASKAKAVIKNRLPYETDSHYVDVALWRYIERGGDMSIFNKDLEIAKEDYAKTHTFIQQMVTTQEIRAGA